MVVFGPINICSDIYQNDQTLVEIYDVYSAWCTFGPDNCEKSSDVQLIFHAQSQLRGPKFPKTCTRFQIFKLHNYFTSSNKLVIFKTKISRSLYEISTEFRTPRSQHFNQYSKHEPICCVIASKASHTSYTSTHTI